MKHLLLICAIALFANTAFAGSGGDCSTHSVAGINTPSNPVIQSVNTSSGSSSRQ